MVHGHGGQKAEAVVVTDASAQGDRENLDALMGYLGG